MPLLMDSGTPIEIRQGPTSAVILAENSLVPRYIYLNRKAGDPIDPKVREFLKFILSEQGQQDVVKEGVFLPLTPQIVKEELQKVQ